MKKTVAVLSAAVLSVTLATTGGAFAHSANGQMSPTSGAANMGTGKMGAGMTGQNMMTSNQSAGSGQMMGHGMMGRGMGQGMMMGHASHHSQNSNIDRNFSTDDVRKILEGHLAWMGHKRLKVGDVKAQDNGALLADINTVDDSLVMRMEVDPKTGAMHPVNE